jgi:hypothetical protein
MSTALSTTRFTCDTLIQLSQRFSRFLLDLRLPSSAQIKFALGCVSGGKVMLLLMMMVMWSHHSFLSLSLLSHNVIIASSGTQFYFTGHRTNNLRCVLLVVV